MEKTFTGFICAKDSIELKNKLIAMGLNIDTQVMRVTPKLYIIKDKIESFHAIVEGK